MSHAGDAGPTGPDLTAGIAASTLQEGTPLLGHARGEQVMLVRRGDEIFAVGATCTHYSGPLAEGLVIGETVRCPWHHACFDLRTGLPKAPALNPIACYEVLRDGALVRVGARKPAPAPSTAPRHAPESIVIIGGGAAGNAAAEAIRRAGYAGPVTLISAEDTVPVDRPNLSKDYLAGSAPEEWIPLRSPAFYAEQQIDLMLGTRAIALEPGEKRVTLADGRTLRYGALLLATGADPIRLPLPGGHLPHVHYLRTFADSRAIIADATTARRAVVMGASFIGLEVAASLRARGLEVHVVAPEARPLERVMGPGIGDFVRTLHESHGIIFHLGQTATAIDATAVTLSGGDRLLADLVVIGAGVRPAVGLAEAAGLTVDRGVVVDEYLRTRAPGIYAAGDVARYPDPRTGERIRIEHWVVAERQGAVAGRNMVGGEERFEDVPFFWSQHYDVTLAWVGHAERWDRIDIDGSIEQRDCTVLYRVGERVAAVLTIFRDRVSLEWEAKLEANGRR